MFRHFVHNFLTRIFLFSIAALRSLSQLLILQTKTTHKIVIYLNDTLDPGVSYRQRSASSGIELHENTTQQNR